MIVNVLTNDHHLKFIPGFAYLFNKYSPGLNVRLFGFKSPSSLPDNFEFVSLGNQLPVEKWSNGFLKMLERINEKYFILMLEDYFLYGYTKTNLISQALDFMRERVNPLRFDLSGDRAAMKENKFYCFYNGLSVIYTPSKTAYQMSLQAAIWNKDVLEEFVLPNESPWDFEVKGTLRLQKLGDKSPMVFGNRTPVIIYQPIYRSKRNSYSYSRLAEIDVRYLKNQGWLYG